MPDELLIDLDRPVPGRRRPGLGRSRLLSVLVFAAVVAVTLGLWIAQPPVRRPPVVPPFVPSQVSPAQMLVFGGEYGYDSIDGYAYVGLTDAGSKPVTVSGLAATTATPGLEVTSVGIGPASASLASGGVTALPRTWSLPLTERMRLYIVFARTCISDAPTVTVTGTATGYGVTEPFSQPAELDLGSDPTGLAPADKYVHAGQVRC